MNRGHQHSVGHAESVLGTCRSPGRRPSWVGRRNLREALKNEQAQQIGRGGEVSECTRVSQRWNQWVTARDWEGQWWKV